MQFQNNTEQKQFLAYLVSLTLLFSYAELLLPKIFPFFRLGLSNTVVLLSFALDLKAFFLLLFLKSTATSLMSGTLFSPFFFISAAQSFASGFFMYLLFKIKGLKKLISPYGISMAGSALSAITQIFLCSIYLGKGTEALLAPMLIFSIFSGLITAFFAQNLNIPQKAPVLNDKLTLSEAKPFSGYILTVMIISGTAVIFLTRNIYFLVAAFIISLIMQRLAGRKIMILPHISIWLFVFISSLLTPSGKVIFSTGLFSVTQGALLSALEKALKLSSAGALSQCAFQIRPKEGTILALSIRYYKGLLNVCRNTEGNIFKKLKTTLSATEL